MTRETLHARPIFLNETHLHLLDSVRKKIDVTDQIPKTFEKSSNMPIIWHKMKKSHVSNCLKPIFRVISSLRITDQFFSEQTLPAFGLVLNDPAVISYKLKIFFVKTIVSTFWVFKWIWIELSKINKFYFTKSRKANSVSNIPLKKMITFYTEILIWICLVNF